MCGIRVRTGFTKVCRTARFPRDCNGDDDFVPRTWVHVPQVVRGRQFRMEVRKKELANAAL